MTTILIVDDDRAMVGMVAALLGGEGFDLLTAYDGETALRRHAEDVPDLVILDRRLPKLSGDEVCRRIRAISTTPILMLTGEKGTDERAALLDLGADDYLEQASVGGLVVDGRAHAARMDGLPLDLTPTEFRILAALAARPGQVIDRRMLLKAGWPDERDPDPEWLKAHLARLRAKLNAAGAPMPENVRGVGYRLG